MARTQAKGTDIGDTTIGRVDLNVATAGQAVITKILEVANSGIKINSSTGADAGTGDVGMILDWTTLDARWLKLSGGTMTNTNVVTNLNADLLDGHHQGDFAGYVNGVADIHAIGGQNNYNIFSSINLAANIPAGSQFISGIQLPMASNMSYNNLLAIDIYGNLWTQNLYGGTWNAWRKIWDSYNLNPITGTGTANYLPKYAGSGVVSTLSTSRIFDNGTYVGVGTISPSTELHVMGNILCDGGDGGGAGFYNYTSSVNANARNWYFGGNFLQYGDFSIQTSNVNGGSPYYAGTSRLYISPSGNVGIATTNPQYSLQVGNQLLLIHNTDFINATTGSALFMGLNTASGATTAFIRSFTNGGANTNNLAIQSAGGTTSFGSISATAIVHIKAGTATAGTSPLKLTLGTAMGTPEDGAFEYDTVSSVNHLWFTIGTTRYQLDARPMSATVGGLVPTPPNDTTKFLSGAGTWLIPAGGTTLNGTGFVKMSGTTVSYDNSTYVTGTPWTSMGYVTGTPWTSMGYVTGTPWTGMGYLTSQISHADVLQDGDFTSQGLMKRGATAGVYSIAINSDLPVMTATVGGAVPTPPNDVTKFLNGQGGWTVPTGFVSGSGSTGYVAGWNSSTSVTNAPLYIYDVNTFFLNGKIYAGTNGGNTFIGVTTVGGTNVTGTGSQGSYNTGFGSIAGALITTGYDNSIFGYDAGSQLQTGYRNTIMGSGAAKYYSGSVNLTDANMGVYIGYMAMAKAATQSNEIVIGASAIGGGSNTVTLGNASITNTFINGLTIEYIGKSSTYSISLTDQMVDCTSGTWTATLPSAVTAKAGRMYVVKNSGTGTLTLATTSSQTIDGSSTSRTLAQWAVFRLVSDGANWKLI